MTKITPAEHASPKPVRYKLPLGVPKFLHLKPNVYNIGNGRYILETIGGVSTGGRIIQSMSVIFNSKDDAVDSAINILEFGRVVKCLP